MPYINLLDTVGEISKKEEVLAVLSSLSRVELQKISLPELNKRAEDENNYRYFTDNFKELDKDDPRIFYIWIDSGYKYCEIYPLYFSFIKRGSMVTGAYVGTEKNIIERANLKMFNKKEEREYSSSSAMSKINNIFVSDPEKEIKEPKTQSFFKELYERLLIKSNWNNTDNGLPNYIYTLINRIRQKYGIDNKDFCIANSDKTKIIFNTNLMDRYGNDIIVKCKIYGDEKEISSPEFVFSKASLIEEGFLKEDVAKELKTIDLFDNKEELLFDAEIEEFDLDNYNRLTHVLEERIMRFPEEVRNLPLEILCSKLVSAIRLAVRISKRDFRYIVPMYSINTGCIQYLIPFHVNKAFNETPELAIIVNKKNGFYAVMTVLPLKEAAANVKSLFPYSDRWMFNLE